MTFGGSEQFIKIEDAGLVQVYKRKSISLVLATTAVDPVRVTAYKGKSRATVYIRGGGTHESLMGHLSLDQIQLASPDVGTN